MRRLAAGACAILLGGCTYGVACTSAGCVENCAFPFMHWQEPSRDAPRMADDRRIEEVECSRPLPEGVVGNVRCR